MAIQFGNSAWQYRIAKMKEKEATKRQREAVPLQLALGLGKALFNMGSTMGVDAVKYFGMGGKEEQQSRMDLQASQRQKESAMEQRYRQETALMPQEFAMKQSKAKQEARIGKAKLLNIESWKRRVESEIGKPWEQMTPEERAKGERIAQEKLKTVKVTGEGVSLTQFDKKKPRSPGPRKSNVRKDVKKNLDLFRNYYGRITNAQSNGDDFILDPTTNKEIPIDEAKKHADSFYYTAKGQADSINMSIGSMNDELTRKPKESAQATPQRERAQAHLIQKYKKKFDVALPKRFVGNFGPVFAEMVGFILQGYNPRNYDRGDLEGSYVKYGPGIYYEKSYGNPLSRGDLFRTGDLKHYQDFNELLDSGYSAEQIRRAISSAARFQVQDLKQIQ